MVQNKLEINSTSGSKDGIRVLFVGDRGVGKTSIIHTLVNEQFNPIVPARMANITVPAEIAPENVSLNIMDYSDREQTLDDFKGAVQEADVICIVFQAGHDEGLDRVATYWIPSVRECQIDDTTVNYKPIILVANKIDLIEDDGKPMDWRVSSIVQEFVDNEAYIETSACIQKNIVELFATAQKAIVYPLAPLFDAQSRILTRKCKSALINIFELCDLDGDGLLSDHELNLFQENCFGTPLQRDALEDLKLIIKQSTVEGFRYDAMTQAGFLFLHTLSIDKGRREFTWQVLKKFNYDNQLNNSYDILSENSKLAGDSIDQLSQGDTSSTSPDDEINRLETDSEASVDNIRENFNQLHLNWISERPSLIKAGLGLTLATMISMIALRYLVQGPRGSSM